MEVMSERSHRTRLAGEQSREVARGMAGLGAGGQLLPCRAGRDGASPGMGSQDAHGPQGLGMRAEVGNAGCNPHSIPSCRKHWSKDISPPVTAPQSIHGAAGAASHVPVVWVLPAA